MWKFYGNEKEVFKHVEMYHTTDMLEGITLCRDCHKKRHAGRILEEPSVKPATEMWCVIPRNLNLAPNPSSKEHRQGTIGLIAYQTLLGIGWNLLNERIADRILTINRRRFAELLGKHPGTSFNRSLRASLTLLQAEGIVLAYTENGNEGNDVEIHISREYLEDIGKNPWFVPLRDIQTNSVSVLCLRLWLGMQSRRATYSIGLDKMKTHMGLTGKRQNSALKSIRNAMRDVEWAKLEETEPLRFILKKRPPTPIRALRAILAEVIEQAK